MNQVNCRGETGEIGRFFAGGVAAADHHQRLVAEHRQCAVTGGAVGHPFSLQQGFALEVQVPMARAAGNDNRLAFDFFTIDRQPERPLRQIDRLDRAKSDTRAEAFRLLLHSRHQFVAVNAFGKAREIFHDAGRREQPARQDARQHERRKTGSSRVKRGCKSGTTRPDDDHFFHKGGEPSGSPPAWQVLPAAAPQRGAHLSLCSFLARRDALVAAGLIPGSIESHLGASQSDPRKRDS